MSKKNLDMFQTTYGKILLAQIFLLQTFAWAGVGADQLLAGVLPPALSVAPAPALVNPSHKLPTPEIEVLPNGLEVVWFVDDRLPIVDLAVLVKAGHRDDPSRKSGVSELLASSLTRGAAGQTAEQIAHSLEILGASHYDAVEEDNFSAGVHGLSPDAGQLISLLGKIVTRSDLPELEVLREKGRILERWKHIGDYSEALASLAYRRILTEDTPYGRGSLLGRKEFETVSAQDVRDFYHGFFTPKNSVLMIVGRVDRAQFRGQVLSAFGGWQGEAPTRKQLSFGDPRFLLLAPKAGNLPQLISRQRRPKILIMDRPGLTQAQVRIGFRAPLIHIPEHHALAVGNALLGEYFNSRLNTLIRDELGLTYGISSGFSYSQELAEFTISSATRNEAVGQVIQKTLEVLERLKKGPIQEEEVDAAKTYLVGGFPLSTATLQAVASRWLAGRILGVKASYLQDYISDVQRVTVPDVQAAIQKYFDLDHLVVVVSGDAKLMKPSLNKAGLISIKLMTASDLL